MVWGPWRLAKIEKPVAIGKGKGKKFLNSGGKADSSGLEDYKYSNASIDDDYDFM